MLLNNLGVAFSVITAASTFVAAAPRRPGNKRNTLIEPHCRNVRFLTSGSAMNRNFSTTPLDSPTTLTEAVLADTFERIKIEGEQVISGLFCEPTKENENNDRLQFAVSQIVGNRNYWNALGDHLGNAPYKPETYSWIWYFTNLGYPILAIDRLGTGLSSKPDPVNTIQRPYELELYHNIVQQIKHNTTGMLSRSYKDLIYCGVSYGSVLGNAFAQQFPNDFSTLILQGFTYSIIDAMAGFFKVQAVLASDTKPLRWQNLPQGYLTLSYEPGVSGSYFGVEAGPDSYDPEFARLYFERQDLVTAGQFVSTFLNITESPNFKGRVLVLTGENDQPFCAFGSLLVSEAHCGLKVNATRILFPNAEYNWYKPDNTGHLPNFFHSAQKSFAVAAAYLDGERVCDGGPCPEDTKDVQMFGRPTQSKFKQEV